MNIRSTRFALLGPLAAFLLVTRDASALTTDEFFRICEMGEASCSENPLLNAYVGGALDLIASLDEGTDYLQPVYCTDPRTLFKIPAIVEYMEQNRHEYAKRNAMILLIRYLEENGRC
ncbi:MAG: hypothetical protein AAGA95_14375 [Pseudomonadota bacterium]